MAKPGEAAVEVPRVGAGLSKDPGTAVGVTGTPITSTFGVAPRAYPPCHRIDAQAHAVADVQP
jgi:hypothetical protein